MLEQSWRKFFGNKELPFYFVQLSSIGTRPSWPHFRDSQRRMAASLPHTWMTVCSDLGDSLDVHPTHKREVAERLAASALCHTYHHQVVPSGPQYKNFVCKGNIVILHFDYAQGLHAAHGNQLIGFELAGADGMYHPAQATIVGNEVHLTADAVKQPQAVRYGWQPFTRANLVNAANIPASTFRDEKF